MRQSLSLSALITLLVSCSTAVNGTVALPLSKTSVTSFAYKSQPQQSQSTRQLTGDHLLPWAEQISTAPRAYVYHNFLSPEECDHIVAMAKPRMKRSTVVGKGGQSTEDNIRTSYGTFLRRLADPVITDVEQRLATWTHLNISHQEDMQILRYGLGQKYGAHYDSLVEGSPRVATVLLYLANTTQEGGETAFPAVSLSMA